MLGIEGLTDEKYMEFVEEPEDKDYYINQNLILITQLLDSIS